MKPLDYLTDHWQGKLPVSLSFWGNLVFPLVLLLYLQSIVTTHWIQPQVITAPSATLVFVGIYLILLPWQIVGVYRSTNSATRSAATPIDGWVINLIIIVLLIMIVVKLLDTLSSGLAHEMALEKAQGRPNNDADVGLDITISPDSTTATVTGSLRVGATRLVAEAIKNNPAVTTLSLESDGGSVFEGRGIGKLIKQNKLSTHVAKQCLSACTLAFAGGVSRAADSSAIFGFHAYRIDALYDAAWLNVDEQQKKDQQWLAEQGISVEFLNTLYQTDKSSLWVPTHSELRHAGFLTASE